MNLIKEIYAYMVGNWEGILISMALLLAFLESVVRLTPTEKDDGAVKRLGELMQKLFDLAKVPNLKKKAGEKYFGVLPKAEGVHEPKSEEKPK